jgi:protein-S-isoprenylcysteine O-methyltransferase Ste14
MTTSRSTPRVRLLAASFLLAVVLVAVSQRDVLDGAIGRLAQLAGLACIVVAALWRIWTSLFIAGSKDTTLATAGPYAACRHPLYAGSLLAALGLGLATRSVTLATLLPLLSGILHARAIADEEALLRELHGAAYERYEREVPAIRPDWRRYSVPDSLTVHPHVLAKAFRDAGSILGAWMLVQLADLLQAGSLTPSLFQLP